MILCLILATLAKKASSDILGLSNFLNLNLDVIVLTDNGKVGEIIAISHIPFLMISLLRRLSGFSP